MEKQVPARDEAGSHCDTRISQQMCSPRRGTLIIWFAGTATLLGGRTILSSSRKTKPSIAGLAGRLTWIARLEFFRRVNGVDCQVETSLFAVFQSWL